MKVLLMGKWPEGSPQNGVEAHFSNLVKHLSRNIEVKVISFGGSTQTFDYGGAEIRLLKRSEAYYAAPMLAILRLMSEIKRVDPDIIHVQGSNPSPYLYSSIMFGGRPVIITMHGLSVQERMSDGRLREGSVAHYLAEKMDGAMLKRASLVVVVDRKKRDLLLRLNYRPPSGMAVIPNGVDVSAFDPDAVDDAALIGVLEKHHLVPGRMILCAKAMNANGGQDVLVRSMRSVCDRDPGAVLLLAGDGPRRDDLRRLVHEIGVADNVVFLGNVPHAELPALLKASSLAVLPSLRGGGAEEGSSIFLLEAMAMGKPVIATDVGGNSDTIQHGRTGLLVPERDAGSMARAILSLLDDDRMANDLGMSARGFVLNDRSWETISERFCQLYRRFAK